MDVPHPRRVAVSMPVRSCRADSRLREHGVPGERSYPPRSVGEWDGGDTDGRGAVLQRLHMVVCGWPILACAGDSCHHSNGHPGGEPSRTHGTYHRDRLVSRRGSRGFASLTVSARPSSSFPLSPWMAALAAALSGISTNPKPLERPVSRSVITLILSTSPYDSKSWRRS